MLYLCSFLIILGYDCTSPRTLTQSRVRIPSLRMFQSWFVVSDLQCFCPLCSNRRAFAFGKRQPRGGASPLPLSERSTGPFLHPSIPSTEATTNAMRQISPTGFPIKSIVYAATRNVFDKPSADKLACMPRRENDGCEETNYFYNCL